LIQEIRTVKPLLTSYLQYIETKNAMITYGWPENFRRLDFERDEGRADEESSVFLMPASALTLPLREILRTSNKLDNLKQLGTSIDSL
jgi:hypothetical protein